MNGSPGLPLNVEPLAYWATSTGSLASMSDDAVRIRSWTSPASSVATTSPSMRTSVSSVGATMRNVSPFWRDASGVVMNCRPHVEVGVSCSTRWSQ